MRFERIWGAGFVAALALMPCALAAAQAKPHDTVIFRGGAVYTLDAAQPWASAVVIMNGRIAYVGDDAGTRPFVGRGARVVALNGRMVLPGFHDAHTHPMSAGVHLLRCQLQGLTSRTRIYAAIRACAKRSGGWLIGYDLPPRAVAKGVTTSAALDRLVAHRPAYIAIGDGYTGWANAEAMAISGIDPNSTGPNVDDVERDSATGRPTGIVKGQANELIWRHLPKPTEAEYREALRRTTAMANAVGITSIFDAAASPAMVDAYHDADLASELTVRVVAAQVVDTGRGADQVDEMVARRDRVYGRRFRADAAKIFVDGEIDQHTGALLAPYADAPNERGDLFVQPDALNAIVRRLDADGFLIHMHVMGDRAVRAGLDAIEFAMKANGPRDRRHQLAHINLVDPSDIPRFGKLGITANSTPLWFQADDPANVPTATVLGPERSRWMYPIGSIAAAGGRITAGSDWTATSMNPLAGIQAAITRQPLNGDRPAQQPQERVTLAAIIAAYTKDAAWAAREDAIDGAIEVGKAADLVVLDRNLFKVRVMELHQVRVVLTLLDGEPVYRDPRFAWPR